MISLFIGCFVFFDVFLNIPDDRVQKSSYYFFAGGVSFTTMLFGDFIGQTEFLAKAISAKFGSREVPETEEIATG
jgi:hypothetical protein